MSFAIRPAFFLCLLLSGCAAETSARRPLGPPASSELPTSTASGRSAIESASAPVEVTPDRHSELGGGYWIGRRLQVYPVNWGRAEDLAAVLEPVVQRLWGPEARVVPHQASNKIFVYIPERGVENAASAPGAAQRFRGVPR